MKEYKVEPDATRTTTGCISLLSFILGAGFCDLAMTPRFTIMGSRCNDMVSYCLFRHFFALEIDASTR